MTRVEESKQVWIVFGKSATENPEDDFEETERLLLEKMDDDKGDELSGQRWIKLDCTEKISPKEEKTFSGCLAMFGSLARYFRNKAQTHKSGKYIRWVKPVEKLNNKGLEVETPADWDILNALCKAPEAQ